MTDSAPPTEPRTRRPRPALWSFAVRIVAPIAVFVVGVLVAVTVLSAGTPGEVSTLLGRITSGASISIAVIVTVVLLTRRVDRRSLREIGMTPPSYVVRSVAIGAAVWALVAVPSFAIFALTGASIEITATSGEFWVILGLLIVAVLLTEAVPEELVFRGYVTRVLDERFRGWWVIIAQSALFATTAVLLHGAVPSIIDLSLYIGLGVGLGYIRLVTGSVWTTVGFHTAFQTVSQMLLTHDVVTFGGSQLQVMLATGAIPFGVGVILFSILASSHPRLFTPWRTNDAA
ncbi:MAG: type II CAAX endopeptidase family protein [Homoserinimonas sp.]